MTTQLAVTEDLCREFGDVVAVDGVSLHVAAGEVVGLLGANGAGKTTLIRLLLGLLQPTSGRVSVLGRVPDRSTRRRLGYMPQGLGLYGDLTVSENLAFTAAAFGVAPPALTSDLARVADVPVAALSLGLRRRTAFAAALCHRPELLVLDEPTSGVGPVGRAELWDTIHESADSGAAVLVTTHYMDEAAQCDRLVVLADGRPVATGTVEAIVGARTTVQVASSDIAGVLDALDRGGLIGVPSGDGVRVPGASIAEVRSSLEGLTDHVTEIPADLEDVFVAMVAS